MLTPVAAFAAEEEGKSDVPAQKSYGEDKPLSLPDSEAGTGSAADAAAGSTGGGLVRTFVGLAVVIAVIYGLYWVLKQVKASREERATGSGLQSAAVVPLGPNRSLHLVRAGRELVLLGVAEHGVTPIRTYSEAEAEDLGLWVNAEPDADDELAPVATRAQRKPAANGAMTIGMALDRLREMTVRK